MRLDTIRFKNFRCFEDRSFNFGSRFNLLIGDNGTGKTSVLNGIAGSLGSVFFGFPEPAVRTLLDVDQARHITYWNNHKANLEPQYPVVITSRGVLNDKSVMWERTLNRVSGRTIRRYSGKLKDIAKSLALRVQKNQSVILPLLGYYGTGRVWNQKNWSVKTRGKGSRFLGYDNCLDPASDEKHLLEWFKTRELSGLQSKGKLPDLEAVREAIRLCISDADEIYWDIAADQLAIRFKKKLRWFRQLSDGYRNMLGVVADLAERCVTLNPALGKDAIHKTPGVVLIDEIDLHLHPKWQRRVVGDLLRAFPLIQFIATSHSPFIIQSLSPNKEVCLINLDDPQAVDVKNKSIEDIADDIQGVENPSRSQRYHEMMKAAEEYYRALETNKKSQKEIEKLKDRLDELSNFFSDDPAYHAILNVEREAHSKANGVANATR